MDSIFQMDLEIIQRETWPWRIEFSRTIQTFDPGVIRALRIWGYRIFRGPLVCYITESGNGCDTHYSLEKVIRVVGLLKPLKRFAQPTRWSRLETPQFLAAATEACSKGNRWTENSAGSSRGEEDLPRPLAEDDHSWDVSPLHIALESIFPLTTIGKLKYSRLMRDSLYCCMSIEEEGNLT